jgi:hypothetical protein
MRPDGPPHFPDRRRANAGASRRFRRQQNMAVGIAGARRRDFEAFVAKAKPVFEGD